MDMQQAYAGADIGRLEERLAEAHAEIARLRAALAHIAAYGDHAGNRYLDGTGTYGGFDEPRAVQLARETLNATR